VGLDDGHLVRPGQPARQAAPLGAAERRAEDLRIPVGRLGVVDDVAAVDPVGRLPDGEAVDPRDEVAGPRHRGPGASQGGGRERQHEPEPEMVTRHPDVRVYGP
jgi:hypothetical protein